MSGKNRRFRKKEEDEENEGEDEGLGRPPAALLAARKAKEKEKKPGRCVFDSNMLAKWRTACLSGPVTRTSCMRVFMLSFDGKSLTLQHIVIEHKMLGRLSCIWNTSWMNDVIK